MTHKLDKIDLKILKALQLNANITNIALSEAVSLSASACLARVQRLKDLGVIDKAVTLLAPSKIGPALHALVEITLTSHNISDHRAFEKAIAAIPEITLALKVSGRFDYLLAITTLDMPALNSLSDNMLDGRLGIAKLVTIPVLDVAKAFTGMPIDTLHQAD